MTTGCEWVVDASGCDPATLTSLPELRTLFDDIVREMDLHPVADTQWHQFAGPGGVTGLVLLAESHLAVHTFPEHGTLCLDLFCCRERAAWDFVQELERRFQARKVNVQRIARNLA